MLVSRVTKRQIQLPSLLWICLIPRLVYPTLILTIQLTNIYLIHIYFPLGKMIGMVRSWTSFILSSQSWEILQSSYRRCRKDEVVLCRARIGHTYMTHSYILKKDPPPQCEHCQCILTVRHILVECNHLAQTRNDIYASSHRQDNICYTSRGALAGTRNSSMCSPWRIDQTTHRTMNLIVLGLSKIIMFPPP